MGWPDVQLKLEEIQLKVFKQKIVIEIYIYSFR